MARSGQFYGHVIGRDGNVLGRVRDLKGGASGSVEIKVDAREIAGLGELIQRAAALEPAAVARALTRTAEQTKTAMGRALVAQTGIPSREVGKALRVINAGAGNLSAKIEAKGTFVPVGKFKPRQNAGGVAASPWNTPRTFIHAFIISRYGGNVYVRKGKGRFPLHKLYGPAVPREFPKDQSKAAFERTVPIVLATRLNHELGRLFGAK